MAPRKLRAFRVQHCHFEIKTECNTKFKMTIRFKHLILLVIATMSFTCCSEVNRSLEISGFKFGDSKQEALVCTASLGYKIEPIGNHCLRLSGDIQALGISWNEINLLIDSIHRIKEIALCRKYSDTSQDMILNHINAITTIFSKKSTLRRYNICHSCLPCQFL